MLNKKCLGHVMCVINVEKPKSKYSKSVGKG
jgi:hypothetical protein